MRALALNADTVLAQQQGIITCAFFFNPGPVRRVPIPNRYTAKAKLCFCKNNKRTIIITHTDTYLFPIGKSDTYLFPMWFFFRNHINELILEPNTLTDSRIGSTTENNGLVSPYICLTTDVRKTMSYKQYLYENHIRRCKIRALHAMMC